MNGQRFTVDRSQRGVRDSMIDTTGEFQRGPVPHLTIRRWWANDLGLIGDDVAAFPTTGDEQFIQHQNVPRIQFAKANRYGVPTIDETAATVGTQVGDAY
jgi:hypothetical protein